MLLYYQTGHVVTRQCQSTHSKNYQRSFNSVDLGVFITTSVFILSAPNLPVAIYFLKSYEEIDK